MGGALQRSHVQTRAPAGGGGPRCNRTMAERLFGRRCALRVLAMAPRVVQRAVDDRLADDLALAPLGCDPPCRRCHDKPRSAVALSPGHRNPVPLHILKLWTFQESALRMKSRSDLLGRAYGRVYALGPRAPRCDHWGNAGPRPPVGVRDRGTERMCHGAA